MKLVCRITLYTISQVAQLTQLYRARHLDKVVYFSIEQSWTYLASITLSRCHTDSLMQGFLFEIHHCTLSLKNFANRVSRRKFIVYF